MGRPFVSKITREVLKHRGIFVGLSRLAVKSPHMRSTIRWGLIEEVAWARTRDEVEIDESAKFRLTGTSSCYRAAAQ